MMSSLLFVLSPSAIDNASANAFPPFACNTSLAMIFDSVAEELKRGHEQDDDPLVYERYIIFDGLFFGMTPEMVQDGVRTKLATTVYAALLDCRSFANFTSTINSLWALMAFIRGDIRKIGEEKTIYVIKGENVEKYQKYLAAHTEIVSDKADLVMYLSNKLRRMNKIYDALNTGHPRA